MYNLYLQAFYNALLEVEDAKDSTGIPESKDAIKKIVFYGVKAVNTKDKNRYSTDETITNDYDFIRVITTMIEQLTPREFMQVFPISKIYDGKKYEVKDYFYTINYIEEHGLDTAIGDAFNFLYEYTNIHTQIFTVQIMGALDNLRALKGQASVFEEFIAENGVRPYTKHQDQQGREYLYRDGRTKPIRKLKKRLPKYMKVIK